jgi:hypothetical protein
MNPDAISPDIGFACQESAFACQARRSFVALAFGDDTCALTFPDQAGIAGARGTGGDVTFRYARAAA